MCYFSDSESKTKGHPKIDLEDIELIANSIFHRALKLQIGCGAEPTLYKGILRIISLGKQHHIPYISITTNGALITKELLNKYAEAGLNEITLSLHVLFAILMCCTSITFAQNKLIDKYADMDGVTSVFISKTMLQMMPNMKTEGLDIGGIAGKLESIVILTSEKASISNMMKGEIRNYASNKRYEELMRVREEGSHVPAEPNSYRI